MAIKAINMPLLRGGKEGAGRRLANETIKQFASNMIPSRTSVVRRFAVLSLDWEEEKVEEDIVFHICIYHVKFISLKRLLWNLILVL